MKKKFTKERFYKRLAAQSAPKIIEAIKASVLAEAEFRSNLMKIEALSMRIRNLKDDLDYILKVG